MILLARNAQNTEVQILNVDCGQEAPIDLGSKQEKRGGLKMRLEKPFALNVVTGCEGLYDLIS